MPSIVFRGKTQEARATMAYLLRDDLGIQRPTFGGLLAFVEGKEALGELAFERLVRALEKRGQDPDDWIEFIATE